MQKLGTHLVSARLRKARERDVDIVSDMAKLSCFLSVVVHRFYTTIKILDASELFVLSFL